LDSAASAPNVGVPTGIVRNGRMRFKPDLKWSDVTPRADFMNRRQLVAAALAAGAVGGPAFAGMARWDPADAEGLEPNDYEDITSYNNFYEFGTGKGDPARYAGALTTDPWTVRVDGLVDKPGDYDLDDLLSGITMEEPGVSKLISVDMARAAG